MSSARVCMDTGTDTDMWVKCPLHAYGLVCVPHSSQKQSGVFALSPVFCLLSRMLHCLVVSPLTRTLLRSCLYRHLRFHSSDFASPLLGIYCVTSSVCFLFSCLLPGAFFLLLSSALLSARRLCVCRLSPRPFVFLYPCFLSQLHELAPPLLGSPTAALQVLQPNA